MSWLVSAAFNCLNLLFATDRLPSDVVFLFYHAGVGAKKSTALFAKVVTPIAPVSMEQVNAQQNMPKVSNEAIPPMIAAHPRATNAGRKIKSEMKKFAVEYMGKM